MFDLEVTVIGGGIAGCCVAAQVSELGLSTVLLEMESGLARGTTSRNSEVSHGGMYYPTGSLKARYCVTGRRLMKQFCREAGVGYRECGKVIVAVQDAVVQELTAAQHRNDTHSPVEERAQSDSNFHDELRNGLPEFIEPKDQSVQNQTRGKDHARLQPTTRTVVAMKLYIEGKEQDEGNDRLPDDSQDDRLANAHLDGRFDLAHSTSSSSSERRVVT